MTIVVGYTTQESGLSALELAAVLARSTGEPLVVTVVIATPNVAGVSDLVDGDYVAPLREWGESVLDRARVTLPQDVEATFEVRQASSIPAGLLESAADADASAMVLGSSSKGSLGRISLGSIIDRLVHTAPLPVLLAPRGFRSGPTSRIRRVSIGYGGSSGDARLVAVGAQFAESVGADLRAVSFLARPPKRFYGTIEESADDLVVDEWVARTKAALETQLGAVDAALDRLACSLAVGVGASWSKAISDVPWADGDLLVLGPSSAALATRLFLGSRASKILRSVPVPVLMVPAPRTARVEG
ncbi:MAG: universal stress protein [Intrasporangium sp.]|uniref:universal stress protein n=1 Tax=Intrasporangium sp. TaxID=1925024 RepID=UPI002648D908|nr:universal stress protein [Intrasporangium sp.]MDN5795179.1 universal stress protein [Intrasporangium sp.]